MWQAKAENVRFMSTLPVTAVGQREVHRAKRRYRKALAFLLEGYKPFTFCDKDNAKKWHFHQISCEAIEMWNCNTNKAKNCLLAKKPPKAAYNFDLHFCLLWNGRIGISSCWRWSISSNTKSKNSLLKRWGHARFSFLYILNKTNGLLPVN